MNNREIKRLVEAEFANLNQRSRLRILIPTSRM